MNQLARVAAIAIISGACGGSSTQATSSPAEPTSHEATPVETEQAGQGHPHEDGHPHQHGHAHQDGHPHGSEFSHSTGHHRFDDADRWAKVFDDPERDAWQKPAEVVASLELQHGMAVTDLGAGTGYFLPYLSDAVGPKGTVLGLDIEKSMVEYIKKRAAREQLGNVDGRIVAPDDPGLPEKSQDRILVVNTWHHIGDRKTYSGKLMRALKPGGAVVIVDFTMESPHGPPKSERLEPKTVMAELEAGGLKAELAKETLPHQYVVFGRRK